MPLPSLARVPAPPDPILGLAEAYRADPRPGKINLSSGVFVDETGTTPVLGTVVEAELRLAEAADTKLYRPIDGEVAYRELVRALALGEGHEAVASGRALATQTPGGTGGLRVAADLLRQTGSGQTLWMSEPTWPNHPQLFAAAGFKVRTYPYTDASGRRIDDTAMLDALGRASPGDIVLLHGCCHNPTGVDPSADLWRADRGRRGGAAPPAVRRPRLPGVRRRPRRGCRRIARAGAPRRRAARLDLVQQDVLAVRGAGGCRDRGCALGGGRRGGPDQRQGGDPDELLQPAGPRRRRRPHDPRRPGPPCALGGGASRDARPHQREPRQPRRGTPRAWDPGRLGRDRRPARDVRAARAVEGTGRPAPRGARGLRRGRGPDQRRRLHARRTSGRSPMRWPR